MSLVSLIGAGPGHPDHLTLRGLRALQAAEVVLYDALLDPAYTALFPPGALWRPVGKRAGGQRTDQADIHREMIAHARAGRRVARLKGGDPFVYGRGGEEALALGRAGIAFEVIAGVSAANGVAAAALIPLTHRGWSREVRLLEGSLPRGEAQWRELAAFRGTTALYMATRRLAWLGAELLAAGAEPDWPVALVENGGSARQVVSRGTLQDAAAGRLAARTDGPGLVLMGPTVPLGDVLRSFQAPEFQALEFQGARGAIAAPARSPERDARARPTAQPQQESLP